MWETISAVVKGTAAALGIIQKRQELNNAPEILNNVVAKLTEKQIQMNRETINRAAAGDQKALDELRKISG
jgi:hypothetical protein